VAEGAAAGAAAGLQASDPIKLPATTMTAMAAPRC
jgi:hypothetical protein